MQIPKRYKLTDLPYGYDALAPYMSEATLRLHHQKHHQAYVDSANSILDRLDTARAQNIDLDHKSNAKALSFNVGGLTLHEHFWQILAPVGQGGTEPIGNLGLEIIKEYGSVERFKKEFSDTAMSVEGSGWACLVCTDKGRLHITQIEKHNSNVFPGTHILLPLDVWEHAYYLDYQNERQKYIDAFWNILAWEAVSRNFESHKKTFKKS